MICLTAIQRRTKVHISGKNEVSINDICREMWNNACTRTYTQKRTWMYVNDAYLYECMYVCVWENMCVNMYVCMYVCMCMCVCMYVCKYVCVCECVCVCVCVIDV